MALSNWHNTAMQAVNVIRRHTPLPVIVFGYAAQIVGHASVRPAPSCNNNREAS